MNAKVKAVIETVKNVKMESNCAAFWLIDPETELRLPREMNELLIPQAILYK